MDYSKDEMKQALDAIASMTARSEKAQAKFAPGTSQHSLQENRIASLRVAAALIVARLAGEDAAAKLPGDALEKAQAPITSLMSKSVKAQAKLAPDSWQHRMLAENLRALNMAQPLLEAALREARNGP